MEDNNKVKIYYVSERNNNINNELELITQNADIYYKDTSTDTFKLLLLYRKNEIPNKYLKPLSEIKSIKEIKLQNGKSLIIDKPSEFNIKNGKYFNIIKPIIGIVNDYLKYIYNIINNIDYEILTTFYINKNTSSISKLDISKLDISKLDTSKLDTSNFNIIINPNNQELIYKQYGFKINISNNDLIIYNTQSQLNITKSLILTSKTKPKIQIKLI
jgi:hypothetical protein